MVPSVFRLIPMMIISANVKKDSPENTAKKVHHSDKVHSCLCHNLLVEKGPFSYLKKRGERPVASSLTPNIKHNSQTTTVVISVNQKFDCFASANAAPNQQRCYLSLPINQQLYNLC